MQFSYLAGLLLAGSTAASPMALEERAPPGTCSPLDPIVIIFKLPIVFGPAKEYCSSLLRTSTTATFTTTPTVIASAFTTTVDGTITTTQTVVGATVTSVANTATVTLTTTLPGNNPFKRDLPTISLPGPLSAFATSKLSSVCSCFITAPTVTVSTTATAPAQTTTTTVIVHTTAVFIETISVTTTTAVTSQVTQTACAAATGNVLVNGGFESGVIAPWFAGGVSPGSSFAIVSPGLASQYAFEATLVPNVNNAAIIQIVQQVQLCPGTLYNFSFYYKYVLAEGATCDAQGIVFNPGGGRNGAIYAPQEDSDWTSASTSFIANSANAFVLVSFNCTGTVTRIADFDNILVEPA